MQCVLGNIARINYMGLLRGTTPRCQCHCVLGVHSVCVDSRSLCHLWTGLYWLAFVLCGTTVYTCIYIYIPVALAHIPFLWVSERLIIAHYIALPQQVWWLRSLAEISPQPPPSASLCIRLYTCIYIAWTSHMLTCLYITPADSPHGAGCLISVLTHFTRAWLLEWLGHH